MIEAAQQWFREATSSWRDWPVEELLDRKQGRLISVVIPARDEQATIGGIVRGIRSRLMEETGLIDEIIVIDSDSTDDTAAVAAAARANVYAARDIEPGLGTYAGKGEALWKSLFVTSGDLMVFIDADLTQWGPHFVTGVLGPLLSEPKVQLTKGFYDRVLDDGSGQSSLAGGRVTELVARPLLNLYWPDLAAVVQPLAGEWAMRRAAFEQLSVPVGYGVEFATLLDVYQRHGLGAIAQIDLGRRAHVHQSELDLGLMAAEIVHVASNRAGIGEPASQPAMLAQFSRQSELAWNDRPVPVAQRPPAISLPHYREKSPCAIERDLDG